MVIFTTLKKVFRNLRYGIIAAGVGFTIFALSVWLRNLTLLGTVLTSSAFSIPSKFVLFVSLLGGIATSVTLFSAFLIILISILFGINTSLFIYYLKQTKTLPRKEGAGAISAFVSGMFGVGCATCGSFLLGSILASFGASGIITLLPLRGEELSILSIILLSLSIYWISKSMQSNKVCAI